MTPLPRGVPAFLGKRNTIRSKEYTLAFTDPISLNNNAGVAQGFTRTGQVQAGSDWTEDDATNSNQRRIIIRHRKGGKSVAKGAGFVKQHLSQFTHEKYNATLGVMEKMTLNVTLQIDPGTTFTNTDIYDLRAFAVNFYTTGNVDKIIRDES